MNYRREIDGLRAVAVLPVILFHAGFKAFEGGFVGVDVFFVISGYLITSIILADMNKGKFSIVTFYERRARRILPALFFVMLCCLPFSWLIRLPNHFKDFFESVAAVSVFSSNFLFWSESGYFDTAAELKPLLHTWSLAVEEQYYLLFPLFLIALWKLRKRWIFGALGAVGAASLALAQWAAYNEPSANFFLLPTRFWELAIGALVGFYFLYRREQTEFIASHKIASELLGALGLALICYSVAMFDKGTPFPSLYALAPTVGTALIIVFSTSKTVVGRVLGMKLMVGIGLISYSAYLWHQPMFSFARLINEGEPSVDVLLMLAALSVGLAYLSWRFVEVPFRDKQLISRKKVFAFAVVGSISFATAGLAAYELRYTKEQREILAYHQYKYNDIYRTGSCFLGIGQNSSDFSEECLELKGSNLTMVWGDSHAASLSYGFRKHLKGIIQITASRCPPIIDLSEQDDRECKDINQFALNLIEDASPKNIILSSSWLFYWGKEFRHEFINTVIAISKKAPGSNIIIIGTLPYWTNKLPNILFEKNEKINAELYTPLGKVRNDMAYIDEEIKMISKIYGVKVFLPLEKLCKEDSCPSVISTQSGYKLTAFDEGHLTAEGSLMFTRKILDEVGIKTDK